MMEANADFIIAIMSQILDVIKVDAFGFWEDMAYNHAPLISPEMVRRYMLPRYRKVAEFLRKRGVKYLNFAREARKIQVVTVKIVGLEK